MSQQLLYCRTRLGGVILVYAKRDLFVLGLFCLSETLCIYVTQLSLAPMLSCAREIHVLCFISILVAYLGLGVGVLCCLEVVIAGCWLCHFGPRLAIGLS